MTALPATRTEAMELADFIEKAVGDDGCDFFLSAEHGRQIVALLRRGADTVGATERIMAVGQEMRRCLILPENE